MSKGDAVRLKSGFSFQQDNTSDAGNRTPATHVIFIDSTITMSVTVSVAHIMLNSAVR